MTRCSKDENRQQQPLQTDEDPSALINNFVEQMALYNRGVMLKSGQRMSVDSAVWYIDAALNTYADAGHAFARLHRDTLYTEMSLVNGYEAAYEEVFDAYDSFLSGLSHHYYEEVEGDNKQFIMARVDNMGPLPGNKQKLRIITLTGTGTLEHGEIFEPWEAYRWHRNDSVDCSFALAETNAALLFEALLLNHFNPTPSSGCRWAYYGFSDDVIYNYEMFPSGLPYPPNYMNYKVFFASSINAPTTSETTCLEFNQHGLGLHEMQYYYDNLKDFVVAYHNSTQNTQNLRFTSALIDCKEFNSAIDLTSSLYHIPIITYRKRMLVCSGAGVKPQEI